MEEEKKVNPAPEAEAETPKNPGRAIEPHGSQGAPRPGDRKYGNHKGRPSERRGGRGGFRQDNTPEYLERVVAINRVCKTTAGGRNMRFSALVVVGDGKGKYGFANCKSGEVPDAIKKSLAQAQKRMNTIKIVRGATIAHEVVGKFNSTKVVLKPAKPGTGIVAGGAVRAVLELSGVKNVVSKVYGSTNAINVIRATDAGLKSLKDYNKVMLLRGKKTEEELKSSKSPKKGDKE